ncbi:MAG: hypothetical protein C5B58_06030 [Acidobacteria bacterium]|nr:MAG: hypothetical protein C5B58_06030 [Acidobacteriota bacterium]
MIRPAAGVLILLSAAVNAASAPTIQLRQDVGTAAVTDPATPTSPDERLKALDTAMRVGNFEPYRTYLARSLNERLRQLNSFPIDKDKIEADIRRRAQQRGVKFTAEEVEERTRAAEHLIRGNRLSVQGVVRDAVRALYHDLYLVSLVLLDDVAAEEYLEKERKMTE